ncbi:hypothetical protein MMC14_008090, partial [Varicellaria rhodocarpa]|nr:hypothetical protein [Varicellaria rhodocarpa]
VAQGVAITFFAETFGGAVFVSAGNNILNNKLVDYIGALNIPSVDPHVIIRLAYNQALVKTFQVALIVACLSSIGAAGMEWKSVLTPVSGDAVQEEVLSDTKITTL